MISWREPTKPASLERSIRLAVIAAALVPAVILAGAGGLLAFLQISEQETARKIQAGESASAALDRDLMTLAERARALSLDSDLARAIQVPVFINQADLRLEEFCRENPSVRAAAILTPDLKRITSYPPAREAQMLTGAEALLSSCASQTPRRKVAFFPLPEALGLFVPVRREGLALPAADGDASGALCLEISWKDMIEHAPMAGAGRVVGIRWRGKPVFEVNTAELKVSHATWITPQLRGVGGFFVPNEGPELRIDTGPGFWSARFLSRLAGLALALMSLLALIAWCAVRLARAIAAPISQATVLVRHFARGEYHYRPDRTPFAELNELARTLSGMGERILAQIEREKESNRAELDALKNQLKPHFLFNSLNGIASAAQAEPARAIPLIQRLADLYRRILESSKRLQQPIRDELALVENYLALEQERFGDRLRYRIESSEAVAGYAVPCLLIQTLAENCVKHGISDSLEGGEILIQAGLSDRSTAVIVIENTGEPLREGYISGTGLVNTLRRLELAHPGKHEFALIRTAEGRTRVRFELPEKKSEDRIDGPDTDRR